MFHMHIYMATVYHSLFYPWKNYYVFSSSKKRFTKQQCHQHLLDLELTIWFQQPNHKHCGIMFSLASAFGVNETKAGLVNGWTDGWIDTQTFWAEHTSTHLSCVLIKTLAVITLTEDSRHQTSVVSVVAHAATTVAGAYHKQVDYA